MTVLSTKSNRTGLVGFARRIVAGISTSRRKVLVYLTFISIAAVVSALNIGGNYLLRFIDIAWPVKPLASLVTLQYAWSPLNLGDFNVLNIFNAPLFVWLSLLNLIGVPVAWQEWLTLMGLLAISMIFTFRIFDEFILQSRNTVLRISVAACCGIVCASNYVVQTVFWWDNLPETFLLMAFGTAFIYFTCRAYRRFTATGQADWKSIFWMGICSVLAFSVNIPFDASLLLLSLTIPLYCLRGLARTRLVAIRAVGFSVATLLVIGLTSVWWIFPSYLQTQLNPSYVGGASAISYNMGLYYSTTSSLSLPKLFTGFYLYSYPGTVYTGLVNGIYSTLGLLGALLIPIVLLYGLIFMKGKSVWGFPLALTTLVITSIFLLGNNSPVGALVVNLLKSNSVLLEALRNPFVALGYGWIFELVVATALASEQLIEYAVSVNQVKSNKTTTPGSHLVRRKSAKAGLVVICAVLLVLLPYSLAAPAIYVGDAVPHSPYQARAVVPTYEQTVADYIDSNLNTGKYALLFPGGFMEQNWSSGYDGYDLLPSLLPGALLIDDYNTGFTASSNPLLSLAYTTISDGLTYNSNFTGLLDHLDVQFVVIEGEVGGTYPFNFGPAPNYSLILASLNHTVGLSLTAAIGPDYIYENSGPVNLVSTASNLLDNNSLVDGDIVPLVNLTWPFFNLSTVESTYAPTPNLGANWTDSQIDLTLTNQSKNYVYAHQLASPLGPNLGVLYYNAYPLNISVAQYPDLILNFTTNDLTAFTVTVVTSPSLGDLTPQEYSSDSVALGGPANSLGYGSNDLIPAYGADHFTSPNSWTLMVDDLAQSLGGRENPHVNYIIFSIFPTTPEGTGLPGLQSPQWPGIQSLQISQISLGADYFLQPNYIASPSWPTDMSTPSSANVTSTYFASMMNTTSTFAPANDLTAAYTGSWTVSLNQSTRDVINASGTPFGRFVPPTFFNTIPLGVNISRFPYMSIRFETNFNAAFSLLLTGAPSLRNLTWNQISTIGYGVGGSWNNLGIGTPKLIPYYGADHYDSPGNATTMVVNLKDLFDATNVSSVQFLLFSFYPTATNGTGLPGVPVTDWPPFENLTIDSIAFSNFEILPNQFPLNYSTLSFISNQSLVQPESPGPTSHTASLHGLTLAISSVSSYNVDSPSLIAVTISIPRPSTLPVLVVFDQTWADGWGLTDSKGLDSWKLVELDGALIGFLLSPSQSASLISFVIAFSPQSTYQTSLLVGLIVATLTITLPGLLALPQVKTRITRWIPFRR